MNRLHSMSLLGRAVRRLLPYGVRRRLRRLLKRASFDEIEWLFPHLQQSSIPQILIDVGAHHGESLEPFARANWRVVAFEPDAANREVLRRRFGHHGNVSIDPRALADHEATDAAFFGSDVSSGISSLIPFHASHRPTGQVSITTLDRAFRDHRIIEVGFLKIDTEGADLSVLKGLPWDRLQPSVIICEFDEQKVPGGGASYSQLTAYLSMHRYSLLVSEWFPVSQYGASHRWRRMLPFGGTPIAPASWGNIIAVRDATRHNELSALAALLPRG